MPIDQDFQIITYHRVCQQQKSIWKTPDVTFHPHTNTRVCQWTVAQVRIRASRHESGYRGSVLTNPCSTKQRWDLDRVQQIHFAPGSNENRHNSRVITGGVVQRWLLITIQSVDVGSCLAESAHHCGRALEQGSKVQGGQLGGNSGEQQQITNYWPNSIWIWTLLKTNSFSGRDRYDLRIWAVKWMSICMFTVVDDFVRN